MILIWSPVRNEASHVEEMIRSVFGQTFGDWRLVISDNHSEDGTAEIVGRYCALDGRITLIRPPEPMAGIPHANWLWRHLADTVQAEAAMLIGGHDTVSLDYVSQLLGPLRSMPSVVCTYPKLAFMVDDANRIAHRWGSSPQTLGVGQPAKFLSMLVQMAHNIPLFGLMRYDAFRAVAPTRQCTAHDHFITAELSLHGDFYEVDGPTLSLRQSPGFGNYAVYRQKHMTCGFVEDVRQQFEWLEDLATRAVSDRPPGLAMAVRTRARITYMLHRFDLSDKSTQQMFQNEFPKLWMSFSSAIEVA